MQSKILNYVRCIITLVTNFLKHPPRIKTTTHFREEYYCTKESFTFLSSSSVVLHVVTTELDGYFFECRKHTGIKKYVKNFIDDYFELFCEDYPQKNQDKKFITESLKNPANFKKFISMGRKLYNLKSPCMEFLMTGNGASIGLNTNDAELIKRLQKFVGQYAWCQINSYNTNKNIFKNSFQNNEGALAIASYEIAKLLNLDYIIPKTKYITLNIDNRTQLYGFFTETAEGCSILPLNSEERKSKITPSLQRDLSNLNVLDVITHEQDHSPNNYNVIINNMKLVTGVRAFDNKGNGAFFLRNTLDFQTFKHCSSFIDKRGLINRPYISEELYQKLTSITCRDLFKNLKGILNPLQIFFCWKRIKTLIKTINKTLILKKDFHLIKQTEWSEKTVTDELSGKYGKTYLISFYSDVFIYK